MFAQAYMGRKRRGEAPTNVLTTDQTVTDGVKAFKKYRIRPMVPDFLHGTPPTNACATFIKESRMKFVNARDLDEVLCGLREFSRRLFSPRFRFLLKQSFLRSLPKRP
jgi:hypothetical protein